MVLIALVVAASDAGMRTADAQTTDFQLTVRNLTDRQPMSQPIVVVHDINAVLLPSSAGRLDGLEEFAEEGFKETLMESLAQRTGVKSVLRFGPDVRPRSEFTLSRVPAEPGDYISVMSRLDCTNDAITVGTAIITDTSQPAFGSGVVWDVGTEDNDELRSSVPCLEGEGVSKPNVEDGEGSIQPHPGIAVVGDLGAVFGWNRTVMEFVVDRRGTQPKRAFDVGATIENRSTAQPITPPVVVVHDKNVNVLDYTRPKEMPGIARLSESGDGSELVETLAGRPGVVSVTQWNTDGPIAPGELFKGNVRAFVGNSISALGMFACTNDGYILASAEVTGSSVRIRPTSGVAKVFDSGAENNDETTETVPCLGGAAAGLSEGNGENGRREHPGIEGVGDLDTAVHGWDPTTTAILSVHNKVNVTPQPEPTAVPTNTPTPDPGPAETPTSELSPTPTNGGEGIPPDTGGRAVPASWAVFAVLFGLIAVGAGALFAIRPTRRGKRDSA